MRCFLRRLGNRKESPGFADVPRKLLLPFPLPAALGTSRDSFFALLAFKISFRLNLLHGGKLWPIIYSFSFPRTSDKLQPLFPQVTLFGNWEASVE